MLCHWQLLASIWALPSLVAILVVRRFPLLTAYFFHCNVSGVYTRVLEYSLKYSSTSLLDSGTRTHTAESGHVTSLSAWLLVGI